MLGIRRLTYHFDVQKALFWPTTYIVQGLSKIFIVPIVLVYRKGREARSIRQQTKLNGKFMKFWEIEMHTTLCCNLIFIRIIFFKYLTDEREAKDM